MPLPGQAGLERGDVSTHDDVSSLLGALWPDAANEAAHPHAVLAFVISGEAVTIKVYDRARDALDLADETPLMVQWPGQWRSDWFQLTVGELRAASMRAG